LAENEKLKKEVIPYRMNSTFTKKSSIHKTPDSLLFMKNMMESEKIRQENFDLKAEAKNFQAKIQNMQKRIIEL